MQTATIWKNIIWRLIMAYESYDEQTAVCFARDVYRQSDRPPLPAEWALYCDCPEEYQKDGYFGAAYVCEFDANGYHYVNIVIAHRGTANLTGLIEDAEMKFFDKVPQQFYDGAIPFIEYILNKINIDYNKNQLVSVYFTGHSLGATLSELSIIKYVNYPSPQKGAFLNLREFTYVFESPGSKDLVDEQLSKGEITQKDIADGGSYITVYNADVDVINTCMRTSASDNFYMVASSIGNNYSSLENGSKLPYAPDIKYYAWSYSVNDQHPIAHVYDWVKQYFFDGYSFKASCWPIGVNTGYSAYKSYYATRCNGFEYHNKYWDQYTTVYWDQNPSMHDDYDDKLFAFQDYYFRNVCYYFDGYALPREISYKFNLTDMQRIERFLSIDDKLMISRAIANSGKDKDKVRSCCCFGFFQIAGEAQQMATTAVESVGRIVTETGEELSRIMPASSNESQKQSFLFFRSAARFIGADGGISEAPQKSMPNPKFGT